MSFSAVLPIRPSPLAALGNIRNNLIDDGLGRYTSARFWTLGGLTALALAFGVILFEAVTASGQQAGNDACVTTEDQ